jgi:hypothetical protein
MALGRGIERFRPIRFLDSSATITRRALRFMKRGGSYGCKVRSFQNNAICETLERYRIEKFKGWWEEPEGI